MLEQLTQQRREAEQEEQRARMRSAFPGLRDPSQAAAFQAEWDALSAKHAAQAAKLKDDIEAMRRRFDEIDAARREAREARAKAKAEAEQEQAREAELEALYQEVEALEVSGTAAAQAAASATPNKKLQQAMEAAGSPTCVACEFEGA